MFRVLAPRNLERTGTSEKVIIVYQTTRRYNRNFSVKTGPTLKSLPCKDHLNITTNIETPSYLKSNQEHKFPML